MHELAITENILAIAQKHAKGQRITALHLVIGQMASIVDDSVQFYWDTISQGTSAEGAKLHFRRIPTEFKCRDCEVCFTPIKDNYTCPNCGSLRLIIVAGEEFFLESIEVITENADC
jgi:hydrogenase nickel incorporation protein HypA/HybF